LTKEREVEMRLSIRTLIIISFFLIASGGCAKEPPKVYRVGIISGVDAFLAIADGFKAGMSKLGYIEGRDIIYDIQKLNADPDSGQMAVRKFVEDKVDLIFAFPTEPAFAAKTAVKGTDIPVLFAMAGIEGNGLVDSISAPGGNITGVRFPGPELTAKRLEILKELAPQAKRVYLIYNPNYPTASFALQALHDTAPALGVTLVEEPVNNLEEMRGAIQKKAGSGDIGVDAILIMPELLIQTRDGWGLIKNFADEYKLPVAAAAKFEVEGGAIFGYMPDMEEAGRMAAPFADKIFKGTPAGTIMVATPKGRLFINKNSIQKLGLKINREVLSITDKAVN
jgi:putative ABC transport system substrate-binding protein